MASEDGFSMLRPVTWSFEVCDPVYNEVSRMDRHIVFTVRSCRDGANASVTRRFTDFKDLRASFLQSHPGAVMTMLDTDAVEAAKSKAGKGKDYFLEKRMRALTLFLLRLSQSPELRNSEHLKQFCEADTTAYKIYAKAAKSDGRSTKGKLTHWMGKKKQAMKESDRVQAAGAKVGKTIEATQRVFTADDAEFDQIRTWINQKASVLAAVRDRSAALYASSTNVIAGQFENLSLAISAVGEGSDNLGAAINLASFNAVPDAYAVDCHTSGMMFAEEANEMHRLFLGAGESTQKRENARKSLQSSKESLQKATVTAAMKQSDKSAQAISSAAEAEANAEQNFLDVNERCMRDLRALRAECATEVGKLFVRYAEAEAAAAEERAKTLARVVGELTAGVNTARAAVPAERPAGSAPPAALAPAPAPAAPVSASFEDDLFGAAPAPAPAAPAASAEDDLFGGDAAPATEGGGAAAAPAPANNEANLFGEDTAAF